MIGWMAPAQASPVSAEDVVAAALRTDPRVLAAEAAVTAARGERREVSTFLANPEVQVGTSLQGDLTWVQVQQPVSLSGEGWYARGAAREGLTADEAWRQRVNLEVAADARWRWAEAAAATLRSDWAAEAAALAAELREVAERRSAAGEGTVVELAIARSGEAVALSEALSARSDRTRSLLALAELGLADPEPSGRPTLAVPPRGAPGQETRTDVRAAEHRAEQARRARARARAASVPAVGVGVQYQSDGGAQDLGPQFTVQIPLWNRGGAAVGAAEGELAVAEARERAITERAAAERSLTAADAAWALARQPRTADLEATVQQALVAVIEAATSGELGIRDAALLQRELLVGRAAGLEVELGTVRASLDAMLAAEDAALLP